MSEKYKILHQMRAEGFSLEQLTADNLSTLEFHSKLTEQDQAFLRSLHITVDNPSNGPC